MNQDFYSPWKYVSRMNKENIFRQKKKTLRVCLDRSSLKIILKDKIPAKAKQSNGS